MGENMSKKLIMFFLLLCSVLIAFNDPVSAGFFKRHKSSKKPVTEQAVKQEEPKKVLVVEIYASWCPGCKNIQPTLDQLVKENSDIELVQLDVSTPSKSKVSAQRAEELHILDFYNANKSKTATVAVITPTASEVVSVFQNNNDVSDYKASIDQAKTKEQALKNPPT